MQPVCSDAPLSSEPNPQCPITCVFNAVLVFSPSLEFACLLLGALSPVNPRRQRNIKFSCKGQERTTMALYGEQQEGMQYFRKLVLMSSAKFIDEPSYRLRHCLQPIVSLMYKNLSFQVGRRPDFYR